MKLTKNFTRAEFDSKDGIMMPQNVLSNVQKLATNLQVLRDHINRPVTINSGYRTPEYNKKVRGVSNSQHLFGTAADIRVQGMTPKQVYDVIETLIAQGKMKQGGLKAYPTFVHYDTRGTKARW